MFFLMTAQSDRCEVISHCSLTCLSLIISNVEHLFMCLLAICMSSLQNCPYPLNIFNEIFFFCFELYEFYKNIFWILTLYQVYDLKIFAPIRCVAFAFCWCFFFFLCRSFLVWCSSHLFLFLLLMSLVSYSKNSHQDLCKNFTAYVSSRSIFSFRS